MESDYSSLTPSGAEATQHLAQLHAAEADLFAAQDFPAWFPFFTGLCYATTASAMDSGLEDWLIVVLALGASNLQAAGMYLLARRQGATPRLRDAPEELKRQVAWFCMTCVIGFGLVVAVALVSPWWITGLAAFVVAAAIVQLQMHRVALILGQLQASRSVASFRT